MLLFYARQFSKPCLSLNFDENIIANKYTIIWDTFIFDISIHLWMESNLYLESPS